MASDIGFSFNPSQRPDHRLDGQSGGGGRGMSPQQAVKILSLRVPERQSQGAIAPLPRVDPLHQAVTQLAFNRLPNNSKQGISLPPVPLPEGRR